MSADVLHNEFSGAVSGASGALAAGLLMIAKQWLAERKEQRSLASSEKIRLELIQIIKDDILARRQMEQYILQVLEKDATSLKALADGLLQLVHKTS